MPENRFAKYRPAGGGPVYGAPPKGPTPVEQERLEIERARLGVSERTERRQSDKDAREARQEQDKLVRTRTDAADALSRVIGQIDQLGKDANDSWWPGFGETGRSGEFMRSMPSWLAGRAGRDLERQVETVDANTVINALQRMRENSPTGGAMGAVSDRDLALLRTSIASLDPSLSHEDFLRNVAQTRKAYVQMLRRVDPEAAAQFERGGGASRRNANPDDIEEIMRKYGD